MSLESSSSSSSSNSGSPDNSLDRLTVQVRSPSMSETLTVHIARSATVNALKREITVCHPAQPSHEDQRIIYAGRLLSDDQALAQILQKTDTLTMPTFHLVVKPSKEPAARKATNAQTHSFLTTPTATQTEPTPERPSMPSGPEFTEIPQQRHTQFGHFPNAGVNPHIPTDPAPLPGGYQLVAINGQYYLAPVLVPSDPAILTHRHPQQQHVQQPYQQQPYEPQTQPPQQPQAGRFPANPIRIQPMRNATSIWLALKLIFVLFIVCQDASIERILISHVVAVVFFLYQTGRLRFAIHRVHVNDQAQQQQPQPQPRPTQQPPQQRPARAAQPDHASQSHHPPEQQPHPTPTPSSVSSSSAPAPAAAAASTSTSTSASTGPDSDRQDQEEQPVPAPAPRPPTMLETVKRGAYTFFASLWPNYGHDHRIAQAIENGQDAWEGL